MQALKVRHVARDVECEDLALALACHFEGASHAIGNDERSARAIPLAYDVLMGLDHPLIDRERQYRLPLFVRKREDSFQLADQRVSIPRIDRRHVNELLICGSQALALCH